MDAPSPPLCSFRPRRLSFFYVHLPSSEDEDDMQSRVICVCQTRRLVAYFLTRLTFYYEDEEFTVKILNYLSDALLVLRVSMMKKW